ncbi:MAG: hypothetical protein K0R39_4240 [Symbiobacteriaceae bacterium]|nr:hypothetical protein [Symbiobacteriaceae bacterium]
MVYFVAVLRGGAILVLTCLLGSLLGGEVLMALVPFAMVVILWWGTQPARNAREGASTGLFAMLVPALFVGFVATMMTKSDLRWMAGPVSVVAVLLLLAGSGVGAAIGSRRAQVRSQKGA